jgi:hypothetical protein
MELWSAAVADVLIEASENGHGRLLAARDVTDTLKQEADISSPKLQSPSITDSSRKVAYD